MAVSIQDAIQQIQLVVRQLPGIKEAPDDPPEAAMQFPFAVTFISQGEFTEQYGGWGIGIHVFATEIHFSRSHLPLAIRMALPLFELFVDGITADETLKGTVTMVQGIDYRFGFLEYNTVPTIGWVFRVTAKLVRG